MKTIMNCKDSYQFVVAYTSILSKTFVGFGNIVMAERMKKKNGGQSTSCC